MKISKILSYVVLAVGAISAVLLYLMNSKFSTLMSDAGTDEARDLPLALSTAAVSPLYNLALVVVVVLLVATLVTVFGGLIKNPSSLKKTGIGIIAFLAIVGISYALAEGQETELKETIVSAGTSKWVGAGIISFYIFSAIAVGAMITAGIKKSISN